MGLLILLRTALPAAESDVRGIPSLFDLDVSISTTELNLTAFSRVNL